MDQKAILAFDRGEQASYVPIVRVKRYAMAPRSVGSGSQRRALTVCFKCRNVQFERCINLLLVAGSEHV
jgi:hypothetical protein